MNERVDRLIESLNLKQVGLKLSRDLHRRITQGDESTRDTADMLHGLWLGHPLHPMLTDITLGAWTFGLLFDVLGFIARLSGVRRAAGLLTTLGTLNAIPTALSGLVDYASIKRDSVGEATLHGGANGIALLAHLLAWRARWQDKTFRSLFWSGLGTAVATFGAWLGGELVYRLRVGVNHTGQPAYLVKWTPAVDEDALVEGVPLRVEVEGVPIMLLRDDGAIHAIHAVCAHAGGPLDEGSIDGHCVQCPWHSSVFDLRNGYVVHGPAVYPQPAYEVRVHAGTIQLRTPPKKRNQSS